MSEIANLLPASIDVVFQTSGDSAPPTYTVNVTLVSLGLSQTAHVVGAPFKVALHRYEYAAFFGGTLANLSSLSTIANQVATDWYIWQLGRMARYYDGVLNWSAEGLHDLQWQQQGGRITTLVQRRELDPREDLLYDLASSASLNVGSKCQGFATKIVERDFICSPAGSKTGTLYKQETTKILFYDLNGCLQEEIGPVVQTAIGCMDCSCGASTSSGACVTVSVPCCPFPLPCVLCVQTFVAGVLTATYTATYDSANNRWSFTVGGCTLYFRCSSTGNSIFQLVQGSFVYDGSGEQCTAILATFSTVDLSACGGNAQTTVQISTGPCTTSGSSGGGSGISTGCCPGPIAATLCASINCGVGNVTLTWNSTSKYWEGSGHASCGDAVSFRLICPVASGATCDTLEFEASVNGSPFSLFSNLGACSCSSPFKVAFGAGPIVCPSSPCGLTATITDDLTNCGGGGGGGGGGTIGTFCCPNVLLPDTLVAAFAGVLAPLGNVTLKWSATRHAWVGLATAVACDPNNLCRIWLYCSAGLSGNYNFVLFGDTPLGSLGAPTAFGFPFALATSATCSTPIIAFSNIDVTAGSCQGTGSCTIT